MNGFKLIKQYQYVYEHLPKDKAGKVFNAHFLIENNVFQNEDISVIDGADINAPLLGFKGPVPESTSYILYYVKNVTKKKPYRRLMECQHADDLGNICGIILHDFNKFFDHMRTHTKEKPYKCTFEGCNQSFAQKGNMNRHISSHRKEETSEPEYNLQSGERSNE